MQEGIPCGFSPSVLVAVRLISQIIRQSGVCCAAAVRQQRAELGGRRAGPPAARQLIIMAIAAAPQGAAGVRVYPSVTVTASAKVTVMYQDGPWRGLAAVVSIYPYHSTPTTLTNTPVPARSGAPGAAQGRMDDPEPSFREASLGQVKSQWRSQTIGSRNERLKLLKDGLGAYVVYVLHIAAVRSSKKQLPSLDAAPPAVDIEDESAMLREAFLFLEEICTETSVPEARQFCTAAGATGAVLEAALHHSAKYPEDDATLEAAVAALTALLAERHQNRIALEKGGLALSSTVTRSGSTAKAKTKEARRDTQGPLLVPQWHPTLQAPCVASHCPGVTHRCLQTPSLFSRSHSPALTRGRPPLPRRSTPDGSSSRSPCGRAPHPQTEPKSLSPESSRLSRSCAESARSCPSSNRPCSRSQTSAPAAQPWPAPLYPTARSPSSAAAGICPQG